MALMGLLTFELVRRRRGISCFSSFGEDVLCSLVVLDQQSEKEELENGALYRRLPAWLRARGAMCEGAGTAHWPPVYDIPASISRTGRGPGLLFT